MKHWLLITTIITSTLLIGCDKKETTKRTISFSGLNWQVKHYDSPHGPGANLWDSSFVEVKNDGLHFKIDSASNQATCSEVKSLNQQFGYGVYKIQTTGLIDSIQNSTVFGLFLYEENSDNPLEVDVEFSKWGKLKNNNFHFSIHNLRDKGSESIKTDLSPGTMLSTHIIKWTPKTILIGSFEGHINYQKGLDEQLTKMDYDTSIEPEDLNFHINYWKFGKSEIKSENLEMVVNKFKYTAL